MSVVGPTAAAPSVVPPATPGASQGTSPDGPAPATQAEVPTPGQPAAASTVPAPAPTAAATSDPSPSAPAAQPSIVLDGAASRVLPFSHPGGSVHVLSEATSASAAGCVYIGTVQAVPPTVLAYDPSLATTVVWIQGAGSGSGWVDLDLAGGTYEMVIESDCTWRVTIAPR